MELAAPIFDSASERELMNPQSDFGPYRIARELGHGGMGTVYVAERFDEQYQKLVALKVLPGWSATDPRRVHRFREERQILAALDHPGIARLLDGGLTLDGLPWFAMELVEGIAIDRYCDERQLSIEDRLDLFCQVCTAVQYAHRNLVVHRDLKPSNILITAEGRVKLLDFGIAKLIASDASTELTGPGERILTPLYASPEQIRGDSISTASDVYALGILLNGLLTGHYPYQFSSWDQHAVARAVLEQEPIRPSVSILHSETVRPREGNVITLEEIARRRGTTLSKLRRRLQGDLDAIVLKAIEKDVARRYGTAEQLETDIRRHLGGLPVNARRGSRAYYTRKFFRRHRVSAAVTIVIALVILAFTVVTAVQSRQIRAQTRRIAAERDQAKAVTQYLSNVFRQAVPSPDSGRGVTAREVLDSAAARVERDLEGQPSARAQTMVRMGKAYLSLGEFSRAQRFLEGALALGRKLPSTETPGLAVTLELLGEAKVAQGDLAGAESTYREALTARRRLGGAEQRKVARTLNGLAMVLRTERRDREAESFSREALKIDSIPPRVNADLGQSLTGLADAFVDRGEYVNAEPLYRNALRLFRENRREESPEIAEAIFGLAAALRGIGNRAESDSLVRYGLALYRRMGAVVASPVADLPNKPAPAKKGLSSLEAVQGKIVFVSDRDGPDPVGHLGRQEIFTMNADGTEQRRVTNSDGIDNTPAWSRDGSRIAFARHIGANLEVFLVNADGGRLTQLTKMPDRGANAPSWSPDGRKIAFQSWVRPDIFVINTDGTGLMNLTDHPGPDILPSWSPDGKKIAFTSNRDGNEEVYLMNSDGTGVVRLTFDSAADRLPSWSPDSRKIVFQSQRDGNFEIYVMNANGSDQRRLTNYPYEDGRPSWSPDGRRIVFHRRVLGHLQVFVMNADGSAPTRITELSTVAFNGFPNWGPAPSATPGR